MALAAKRKARSAPSRAESSKPSKRQKTRAQNVSDDDDDEHVDVDASAVAPFLHAPSLHVLDTGKRDAVRAALLEWYSTVHDARGMPWRKSWDETLSQPERAQRAYEVWVSEIMLQQTQVVTVVPYYTRWMERFPNVQALAEADIEEVNALWKGLGYYSRAARLLAGAQVIVKDFAGVIPSDPAVLEKKIPGIGRYSAGAITSIAYGVCAPVLDGNVHRLLSRVLALHAPQQAKTTLTLLWSAAAELVTHASVPGDVNQALIELGATVCKPRNAACGDCPIRSSCAAYGLPSFPSPSSDDIEDLAGTVEDLACTVCEPLPVAGGVSRFPMAKVRKKAREETDVACVVWCGNWVLLRRRPDKGLLGGLYEFPTTPATSSGDDARSLIQDCLLSPVRTSADARGNVSPSEACIIRRSAAGDVLHIFSHIRKTWKVIVVHLSFGSDVGETPETKQGCKWVRQADVPGCNLGTGTLKLWHLAEGVGGPTTLDVGRAC